VVCPRRIFAARTTAGSLANLYISFNELVSSLSKAFYESSSQYLQELFLINRIDFLFFYSLQSIYRVFSHLYISHKRHYQARIHFIDQVGALANLSMMNITYLISTLIVRLKIRFKGHIAAHRFPVAVECKS